MLSEIVHNRKFFTIYILWHSLVLVNRLRESLFGKFSTCICETHALYKRVFADYGAVVFTLVLRIRQCIKESGVAYPDDCLNSHYESGLICIRIVERISMLFTAFFKIFILERPKSTLIISSKSTCHATMSLLLSNLTATQKLSEIEQKACFDCWLLWWFR